MYYSTRAIILSSVPQGERGNLFILLTEERGLVHAQGQGVRSPRSKLGCKLTPYRLLSLNLTHRTIDRIIGVEVMEAYETIWRDARRQGYAAWAAAFLQQALKPGVRDEKIFALFHEYLQSVNDAAMPETDLPSYRLAFAVRNIECLGHSLVEGKGHEREAAVLKNASAAETLKKTSIILAPIKQFLFQASEAWVAEMSGKRELHPSHFLQNI